jgi:hypothetical protein
MKLNAEQIKLIDKHLRSGMWLTNPQFIAEMQDHYSCAMEEYLSQNMEWKHALRLIDISFQGRSGLMKMEENYMNSLYKLGWSRLWKYCKKYLVSIPHNLLTVCLFCAFYFLATQTKVNIAGIFEVGSLLMIAFTLVLVFYLLIKHNWNIKKYQQQFHVLSAWTTPWYLYQLLFMHSFKLFEPQTNMWAGICLALLATLTSVYLLIGIEICTDIDWKGEKEIAKA